MYSNCIDLYCRTRLKFSWVLQNPQNLCLLAYYHTVGKAFFWKMQQFSQMYFQKMVKVVLVFILLSSDSTLEYQSLISKIALDVKSPKFFCSKISYYICSMHLVPYIGNHPRKKKFTNFVNLEAFANVFLHFLILARIFIYEIAWIAKVFLQTMVKKVIRETFLPRMIPNVWYIMLIVKHSINAVSL